MGQFLIIVEPLCPEKNTKAVVELIFEKSGWVGGFYGVTVTEVNTVVVPGKAKSRFTKAGVISGRKPAYKKAYVKVAEGETIDLYANI